MENTTVTEQSTSRVRINLSTTAKGLVQWDITAEFPTLEESQVNISSAIDQVRALIKEKGMEEAKA